MELNFNNLDDIMEFAIGNEKEAERFYASLAEKETRSGTREMFLDFAGEEAKHAKLLVDLKKGKPEKGVGDYDFKWIDDIKRGDFVKEPEYRPGMPYQEILLIAIKREENALKLYREMYRHARSDAERSIFRILRQEEAKHKLKLEMIYDDFMYEMGD